MSWFWEALQNAPLSVKMIVSIGAPAALALGTGIALAFVKRSGLLTLLLYVSNTVVSFVIFQMLPDFVREGGPLVGVLIFILILLITYIFERFFTLKRAMGGVPVAVFKSRFLSYLAQKDFDGAMEYCKSQTHSAANILETGLRASAKGSGENATIVQNPVEIRRTFEEALSRETPILERNLVVLTTVASISTMIGLLGTTIGMIRAFQAMAHAGAPDAVQLAKGISEALFNTAGGLLCAIFGITANNFFINKVDQFTYEINEAVHDTMDVLETLKKG